MSIFPYFLINLANYSKLELNSPSRALANLAAPQGFASLRYAPLRYAPLRSALIIQIKNAKG